MTRPVSRGSSRRKPRDQGVRLPARGRDETPEARRAVPAPLLVEEPGVSGVADLPLPADLHVLVGIVGADADVPLLALVEEEVVEHPATARRGRAEELDLGMAAVVDAERARLLADRKSTRLNSSHLVISYAVFCLKKKKTNY